MDKCAKCGTVLVFPPPVAKPLQYTKGKKDVVSVQCPVCKLWYTKEVGK